MAKSIQGHKIKKELGLIGNIYFNNFGVETYLLEDGDIMLQSVKFGKKLPKHFAKISREFFDSRFDRDGSNSIDNIVSALKFLDPDYSYYYDEEEV